MRVRVHYCMELATMETIWRLLCNKITSSCRKSQSVDLARAYINKSMLSVFLETLQNFRGFRVPAENP